MDRSLLRDANVDLAREETGGMVGAMRIHHGDGEVGPVPPMKLDRRANVDVGDANAQAQLGFIYDSGRGLPRDPARAHFWYMKAAEQGHTDAQAVVGYQFQNGHGTTRSYSEARRWYEQAAAKGQPLAQTNLGFMYEQGDGVPGK